MEQPRLFYFFSLPRRTIGNDDLQSISQRDGFTVGCAGRKQTTVLGSCTNSRQLFSEAKNEPPSTPGGTDFVVLLLLFFLSKPREGFPCKFFSQASSGVLDFGELARGSVDLRIEMQMSYPEESCKNFLRKVSSGAPGRLAFTRVETALLRIGLGGPLAPPTSLRRNAA